MARPPTPATSPSSRNARARDFLPGGGRAVGAAAGHSYRWRGQRRQPHSLRAPGGPIARGALLDIAGIRLGTSARTTSVTVSARGASFRVPLLAVSPQRIQGRLPAGAPLGDVLLTVTVNGAPSVPYALKVVSAGFGIFSRNQEGWGPGRVDNQASDGSRLANSLRHSARPGELMVLSGTGLGASPPEVWVGLRRATVAAVPARDGG